MSAPRSNEQFLLELIASRVLYKPDTGQIFWRPKLGRDRETACWNRRYAGNPTGTLKSNGYVYVSIIHEGKRVFVSAHRLAWFMAFGAPPQGDIDHINQLKQDNRIENLRDVPQHLNARNQRKNCRNTSGFSGVTWNKGCAKWQSYAKVDGKYRHLGVYEDPKEAAKVAKDFRLRHGFTESHGKDTPHGSTQ